MNYEETIDNAKARFAAWLDGIIVAGLDAWRRQL